MRIALLQMNIDRIGHSFYHPICEVNRSSFKEWESYLEQYRRDGKGDANTSSFFEAWRRAILREALERCETLQVELLILPEYSMRPETVGWLIDELAAIAPQTAVLAGTFRRASRARALGFLSADLARQSIALGAVEALVVPGPALRQGSGAKRSAKVYSRLKKYPSTGLSEFIRPERRMLQAIYNMVEDNDPDLPERLRYIRDLICSEVFVTMAPANIFSTVPALTELYRRFGIPGIEFVDHIIKDVVRIGQDTSPAITRGLMHPRQTVIAVPAATTRPFDHHIFGEAGAKAAGLTTVFTNMAGKGFGKSCFIGHYRSKGVEGSNIWSLQSPYQGRAPGLWTYSFSGGNPLGENETALVVADVNPIDSSPSKPSRQIENQPLSLVAHIPFFLGEQSRDTAPDEPNMLTVDFKAREIAKSILELLASDPVQGSACDIDPEGAANIHKLAAKLAEVDGTAKESIKFRSEGLRVVSMQPHAHPIIPALTDWAYIPYPPTAIAIEVPPVDAADLAGLAEGADANAI
jgi:hypothetical protein